MRISDWSSDVCSSDLGRDHGGAGGRLDESDQRPDRALRLRAGDMITGDLALRRVAVVGSGVAGLHAPHVASAPASVTLFEADDRLGGHAATQIVERPGSGTLAIYTGLILHTPPNGKTRCRATGGSR